MPSHSNPLSTKPSLNQLTEAERQERRIEQERRFQAVLAKNQKTKRMRGRPRKPSTMLNGS